MTTTWNPADLSNCSLSNGNLTVTGVGSSGGVRSTTSKAASSGKFQFECTIVNQRSGSSGVGIALSTATFAGLASNAANGVIAYLEFGTGAIWVNGSASGSTIGNAANGDILTVCVDTTAKLFWVQRNGGNWNGSPTAIPATGTGGLSFSALAGPYFVAGLVTQPASASVTTANFGATAFNQALQLGFAAWDASGGSTSTGMLFGG